MSVKVRNVLAAFETLSEMFCRIQRLTKDVDMGVGGPAVPESLRALIPSGVDAAAVDAAWKRGPERADVYPDLNPNEINETIISIVDAIVCSGNVVANPLHLTFIALLNGIGQARNERNQFRQTVEQLSQTLQEKAKPVSPEPAAAEAVQPEPVTTA